MKRISKLGLALLIALFAITAAPGCKGFMELIESPTTAFKAESASNVAGAIAHDAAGMAHEAGAISDQQFKDAYDAVNRFERLASEGNWSLALTALQQVTAIVPAWAIASAEMKEGTTIDEELRKEGVQR